MQVTIFGAGRIGVALAHLINNGQSKTTVELWDVTPTRAPKQKPLEQIVPQADVLFLCVSSWHVRGAIDECSQYLRLTTLVVSLTKGIERDSGKTMDELLVEALPREQPFAVLGGPMMAEELKAGKPGVGVVGSKDKHALAKLKPLFAGTALLLELSPDPHSVTLAGVLKNVYALTVGITDGLGWNKASRKTFMQEAFDEMLECGRILKIHEQTLQGPAGAGDFITTASSKHSRNRTAGEHLGKTGEINEHAESIASFSQFTKRIKARHGLPILNALMSVLTQYTRPEKTFAQFKPR